MNGYSVNQDWEKLAQNVLVHIRQDYAQKKKEQLFIQTMRATCQGDSLQEGARQLDGFPGHQSRKETEDVEGTFLTSNSGTLPPAWLFSMYFTQNLVKRGVVSNASNSYLLSASCTQASILLTLVSCAADCLIYDWQRRSGTHDPLAAPWKTSSLLSTVAVGVAAGLTNFCCLSIFTSRTSLIIGFFTLILVSRGLNKLQDAMNNEDTLGAWKFLAAISFMGPQVWTECGESVPHDLCCPISQAPFVEPVVLQDMVFEKDYVCKWIHDNGIHPIDREQLVSCSDLELCPAMKALVAAYARRHGMRKVLRPMIM